MSFHSTDSRLGDIADSAADSAPSRDASVIDPSNERRRRRSDWRLGGRAVRAWGVRVPLWAIVAGAASVIAALLVRQIDEPWAPWCSLLVLWLGMGSAVIYAFLRGRPAGLLKFRATDFLWGVGLGICLRFFEGVVSAANQRPFPVDELTGVGVHGGVAVIGASLLGGPLVEEFFFRTVILVSVYELFRRSVGAVAAALTAVLTSAGLFVVLHAAFNALGLLDGLMLFAVGACCALLVVLTGRVWAAVLLHLTYNALYLVVAILGGLLS